MSIEMRKIKYESDKFFGIIMGESPPINNVLIYTRYNNFMEHNPPCKKCLIQNMCIRENIEHETLDSPPTHLYIRSCKELRDFIVNSKIFFWE